MEIVFFWIAIPDAVQYMSCVLTPVVIIHRLGLVPVIALSEKSSFSPVLLMIHCITLWQNW